jgi:ATP-dependent helicase/nuclease subunit A
MTVHGSKGLQAPIVIMPDTTGKPQPPARGGDRILWPDGSLAVPLWAPRAEDAPAAYTAARDRRAERLAAEYRRLLYVALTRAQDRLYLCGHLGKRERTADCWHALCEAGLRDVAGVEADAIAGFDEPGLRLETRQERDPGPEPSADAVPLHDRPAWLGAAAPPEPLPYRPLTPSRPAEPDPPARSPLEADDGARFRRGALIHTLLQHLPGLPPAARPEAAAAWMARQDLAEAERDEIVATTLAVLDAPDHAALFGPGSRAEVPVTGIIGDRVLAGQIDRLMVTADTVTVLDFKTNRPPPATEAAVGPAYLAQMAAYRAALRAIYPGRAVRCLLLWTEGPRLMPLSDELLDRHAPGMMAKS